MDYLPTTQEALRTYANNAAALLVADAPRYGVMQAEADSFKLRADDYSDKLDIALTPSTRNVTTIASKNLARTLLLQLARPMLQRIRDDMGVAPEDKLALSLRLPDPQPTPVPVPQTAPVLRITADGLVHILRYHDSATPDSEAKPEGAASMVLFSLVNPATPPTGPEDARFVRNISRQRFRMEYASGQSLKTVYYWARWQTATGEMGPWSDMTSKVIAA